MFSSFRAHISPNWFISASLPLTPVLEAITTSCIVCGSDMKRRRRGLRCLRISRGGSVLREPLEKRLENYEAVSRTQFDFRGALGVRHQAHHVAFAIADAGNICDGAIGICGSVFTD